MLLTETGDPGGELSLKWRHNESRLEHAELDVLIEIPSKQVLIWNLKLRSEGVRSETEI